MNSQLNSSAKEADDWFKRKFGASLQQNSKKKNTNKKYDEVRGELVKQLAVRRHDGLENRYSFYNAENEIFEGDGEENEEEEEEELDKPNKEDEEGEGKPSNDEEENDEEEHAINSPERKKQRMESDEEEEEEENGTEPTHSLSDEEEEIEENLTENNDSFEDEDGNEDPMDEEENETIESDGDKMVDEDDDEEPMKKRIVKKRRIIEDDDEDDEVPNVMAEESGNEAITTTLALELIKSTDNADLFTVEDETEAELAIDEAEEEEEEEMEQDENELPYKNDEKNIIKNKYIDDTTRKRKMKELLEEEASLSGDDVGSDQDEDDNTEGLDEYEAEEGDMDKLPEDEDIRDNLVRQYMKHQKDTDDRKLLKLQELFFADSDLHGKGSTADRSFRLRMHDDSKIDWTKIFGNPIDGDDEDAEHEENEEKAILQERRVEMLKWKLEEEKKKRQMMKAKDADGEEEDEFEEDVEEEGTGNQFDLSELCGDPGELFKLGEQILCETNEEEQSSSQSHSHHLNGPSISSHSQMPTTSNQSSAINTSSSITPKFVPPKRDSLLTKADFLVTLVKEGKNPKSLKSATTALYTHMNV